MPKVSVVIPVYNVEAYLADCLNSVLSQSLADIEVLCIDDASPDGCPQILDRYASLDPRVTVFHLPENRRQGYGRNLGLSHASGEYVYFLDSDDMIRPDTLRDLTSIADRDNLDAVFFDSETIYESEELAKEYEETLDSRKGCYESGVTDGRSLLEAFWEKQEWTVLVQRQFWRRSFLLSEGISFPEGAEHEDQFFTFTGFFTAKRVRYVREPYFIRRFRPDSVMTSKPMPKNFHGYFVNVTKLITFFRERNIEGDIPNRIIQHLLERAVAFKDVFRAADDPLSYFSDDRLKDTYILFEQMLQVMSFRVRYDSKLFAALYNYTGITIYGAGRVASSVFDRLCKAGFKVDGFVVSSMEGNPDTLLHRTVTPISDYRPAPGSIVLVAVATGTHREISEKLSALHIEHFTYAKDILKGPFL